MGANASIPAAVLTDSYKASHYLMYPPAKKMMAYGEFRGPFEKDKTDTRFVFYGIRHALESIVLTPWTMETIELAGKFFATHNAGASDFPFPRDLLTRVVEEHDGYLPVKIEALPEGTVANARVPVYQITAEGDFARLVTFLETILTQVWYPTCVATLSRRAKELIRAAFETSVDADGFAALDSRLHDFGFRGCSSVEQSVIGGTAHLLNFTGTDTMSAAYHAQYALNEGRPVGFSIPATEHSVMTAWPSEEDAIRNMIDRFGGPGKVFSIVMDSYDYERAIFEILPRVAEHHLAKGGVFVIRPDSGDPIQCVLQALDACEKAFGATVNAKGYKVVNNSAVLQGDGINIHTIEQILAAVLAAGYSAQSVAFGMGGGLLQKVNRDTMQFATKLSFLETPAGEPVEVMKRPKTDGGKVSFPGQLQVLRDPVTGAPAVYPCAPDGSTPTDVDGVGANLLEVVYNCGPVPGHKWPTFDEIRARVEAEWPTVPKTFNPISRALQDKMAAWRPRASAAQSQ